jgi:hypothetical protein
MTRSSCVLLAVSAVAACEPVDDRNLTVLPNSIVLDNFEDQTAVPLDPRFTEWEYTVYNTTIHTAQMDIVRPGHDSNWALRLTWTFTDEPNGTVDYPGALERTQIPGSLDLRLFTRFVFSHRYDDAGTCTPVGALTLNVQCREHNSVYQTIVPTSATWQTTSVSLSDFVEAAYQAKGVTWDDCFHVADEISITTQPNLEDGGCSAGALLIDDVSIR